MRRNFLFLQGSTSNFFHELGKSLRERGHSTGRVNFNVGDALFWKGGEVLNFREPVEQLPSFLFAAIKAHGYTDVVMLGDTRPVHAAALGVTNPMGLVAHIYDEGYFRPGWLTLERGGINGNSQLPKDPNWFRDAAHRIPVTSTVGATSTSISLLATWEVAYHLPNLLNPFLYPGYRTHRPAVSGLEFWGWSKRFICMPILEQRDRKLIKKIRNTGQRYFVFPLQLDGDSQVTHHSSFNRISEAILHVMHSFEQDAPAESILVIKNHPLDTGLGNHADIIAEAAKALQIAERVVYLESGDLSEILSGASGVVTINSTVGSAALEMGCPVLTLGEAIYDFHGLTSQQSLQEFWSEPAEPDLELFQSFKRTVIYTTQVHGGFFGKKNCQLAVENSLRFLEPELSPLEELLN